MLALDAIVTIGGLVLPAAFDFMRKKFIPAESDTPERTLTTLATTNPDVMGKYNDGLARYLEAKVKWFNRDVIGQPSMIVINIRALIRPLVIIIGLIVLVADAYSYEFELNQGVRIFFEGNISTWFGQKFTVKGV